MKQIIIWICRIFGHFVHSKRRWSMPSMKQVSTICDQHETFVLKEVSNISKERCYFLCMHTEPEFDSSYLWCRLIEVDVILWQLLRNGLTNIFQNCVLISLAYQTLASCMLVNSVNIVLSDSWFVSLTLGKCFVVFVCFVIFSSLVFTLFIWLSQRQRRKYHSLG